MSQQTNELYSLLIPLQHDRLLVPRICIAEVIAFADRPEPPEDETPDWFLGTMDWNGRRLPVVSLDGAEIVHTQSRRNRRRVVVFHGLTDVMRGRYYGVVTQGFPQLIRVNADVISADLEYVPPEDRPILCRVRMIHEFPLVPDFDKLEQMIAEHSSA
jgi:chemosensory pili system protein ChpC